MGRDTMLTDIIVSIILCFIFGGAIYYIVKSKKSGKRCIGCPDASTCGKKKCECENIVPKKEFKVERNETTFNGFEK
jgi:hypothetical protein